MPLKLLARDAVAAPITSEELRSAARFSPLGGGLVRCVVGGIEPADRFWSRPWVRETEAAVVALDHGKPESRAARRYIRSLEQQRPLSAAAQEAAGFLPFDDWLRRTGRGRHVAAIKAHSCSSLAPAGPPLLFPGAEYTGGGKKGQLERGTGNDEIRMPNDESMTNDK